MSLAFGRSGRVQIELIQPIDGEGLTHDFLAEYGPGAHHLAFLVERVADKSRPPRPTASSARCPATSARSYYVYLDTFAELGVYIELVEDPDGLVAQLTP